jgi:hypothetical protein
LSEETVERLRISAADAPLSAAHEGGHGRITPASRRRGEPRQSAGCRQAITPLPSRQLCLRDANGQAYIYSRENEAEARQAKMLTKDETRRIAINVARLPGLLGKVDRD